MKKLACAIAVSGLIGTPAFAADMAVKAPPPAPAPAAYNWSGWYVGVNAGASFGNVKTDFNVTPVALISPNIIGFSPPLVPGFAGSNTEYPSGFIGGGQIGYNWQLSPIWVVGLEADFQGALEKDSNNLSNSFSVSSPASFSEGTAVTNYTTKIEWFGTARLRAGYVWGDGNVMSYLTGGLAYGKVDIEGTNTVSSTTFNIAPGVPGQFSLTQAFGHSQVNTGWVVGYGTEGRLATPGWTWKVEGLWMDLGHVDAAGVTSASGVTFILPGTTGSLIGGQVTTHSHFTDGILRAGLNYQFH